MNDYKELFISSTVTLLDALKQLDVTGRKILFVIDNNKLVGALSDGDVRRWLLQGGDLAASVQAAMKKSPYTITRDQLDSSKKMMEEKMITALPVVDQNGTVIDIVFLDLGKKPNEKIHFPVVIMAGGKGTRLYPYTRILPKPLIPIGDIPISEHIINQFYDCGCEDFYLIVNYKKNMIKAYFNEIQRRYNLTFIDEEEPLGTGGGVGLLKGKISSTFILTNCDSIIQEDYANIIRKHEESKNLVTMICSLRNYSVPYGVVDIGPHGEVTNMREKPSMSYFTNTGTYVVEPDVIDMVEKGKRVDFPDIIRKIQSFGQKVGAYPVDENSWLDMGQFDSMEEMKKRLRVED